MSVKTYLRPAKGGKSSIYVNFILNGKRKRNRTGMFYYDKPKNKAEKEHNKATKKLTETYIAQLTLKIQNNELGIKAPKSKAKDFVQYFAILTEHRKDTGKNYHTWRSTLKHLKAFNPSGLKFSEMDIKWLERFRQFLLETQKLKSASANSYFNVLKHGIHDAFRDRLIDIDYAEYVKAPTVEQAERQYLTEEEVLKLERTECKNAMLKKAFLFSCRTGISKADIQKLQWKDIKKDHENNYFIPFNRQKTKGLQYHPINKEAIEILGKQSEPNELIFKDLKFHSWQNAILCDWVYKAGIQKKITFHCARHTYATILLHKGADITQVNKLLGHADLKTTQIYAKVMPEDLRIAAELMSFNKTKKD
ncbi:site-specific integrase [Kordia zhangzhouensis]|uniref:site-specific integrase n=1 Tax=Kordia zhangzhouensis TaxID=1620405 RepID=UPI0006299662|nr:site-specific integrase [Kordia zhangzhouensis]